MHPSYSMTVLIFMVGILCGCISPSVSIPPETRAKGTAIEAALPNTEYLVEWTHTGKAQLTNGVFEEFVTPDAATKIRVHLGQHHVIRDMNDDGVEDAAVTLIVDPGGSATFVYLAVLINEKGTAKAWNSVFLGDRIIVNSLAMEHDTLIVNMFTRHHNEPMIAEPKVPIVRRFRLQHTKRKLVEMPNTE